MGLSYLLLKKNQNHKDNRNKQVKNEVVIKWEVDHTVLQGIPSHTGSPERTDASERIHTET